MYLFPKLLKVALRTLFLSSVLVGVQVSAAGSNTFEPKGTTKLVSGCVYENQKRHP